MKKPTRSRSVALTYEKTENERSELRGIQPGRPGLMNAKPFDSLNNWLPKQFFICVHLCPSVVKKQ